MNKRYLHNQCPDSICSVYFLHPYKLRKTGVFFSSSHSAGIQLGNTRSCSASSHEDGEGQESKRTNREEHRDTALGRLCTSHTENMHTHNEGFHCFLALFFVRVFFFNNKKIIPAKAGCAKLLFKNHPSV